MTDVSTDEHDAEVLVVGAGPVGLTAACQLARLGVPVTIVDALEHPTAESRAVAVHARSLETWAALGVVAQLERRGRRIGSMNVLAASGDTPLTRIAFHGIASRHPYLLDIAQPETEEVLTARAAELGVAVRRGTALVTLTQDDDGVDVTLRGPDGEQSRRVGWVLAADGGHSTTRHLVGTRLDGTFHGRHFAMADVDVDTTLARDAISMFPHPAGMTMLFPLEGDRARVMFMVDDPGDEELTFEQVQALAAERTAERVAVRDPRWLTYFEVHHGQVPQYRHGRVFLAGDAAHIHSPAGGQGMNTGIQDAANLAWKLALVARGRAAPQLLDSYHDERHPVGEAVVRGTTRLTDAATKGGAVAALRNLGMWVVGHVRPLNEVAATAVSEVVIAHRQSALSVEHGHRPHGSVRAGEHVPDPVGIHCADGTPLAVEDLFARHPGMLLLLHGEPHVAEDLRGVLGDLGHVVRIVERADEGDDVVVDPDGVLTHALGVADGGLALVRPDGYVGLLSPDVDPDTVRRYLTGVLHVRDEAPARQVAR